MDAKGQQAPSRASTVADRGARDQAGIRRRLTRALRSPAVTILLVAPFLGEVLSTSLQPIYLLLPWNLALLAALYGSGALICRELARRYRLGLPGLCLLAAAYAVYEEALIVGTWFDPHFQDTVGIGSYSRIWHTNLLLATHLTAFHISVSICSSILLVETMFPAHRDRAWTSRRGLVLAVLALVVLVPLGYGDAARGPAGQMLAAAGLCVLLIGCAFLAARLAARPAPQQRQPRPRLAAAVAFACTATHFILVYTLASTGLPWPVGVLIALAPVAGGIFLIRHLTANNDAHRPPRLRVVTGILAFFILLDALVGLGGRYDLIAAALATALALWWLHRRQRLSADT